ncbi:MAG: hypothetical protein HYV09_23225 [Deltaproteobacteria bacterium]|nr:hypothetical protein [Deltaproteobacteria bacterium]
MRHVPVVLLMVLLVVLLSGCASSAEPATTGDAARDIAPDVALDVALEAQDDAPSDASADAASCTLKKPYSSKDATCNACAEAKCCAEVNGCLADPRCDDHYVNCILACALLPPDAGDAGAAVDACVADCGAAHPQGKAAYDTAIGCVDTRCGGDCE